MASRLSVVLSAIAASLIVGSAGAQDWMDEENLCIACHANPDVWEEDTKHLHVTPADLANERLAP